MEYSTPPVDPLLGTVFGGKYRIIEKVGTGGMGGIYRAEHSMIGRIVALKVIRSHLLDDELQQKRFRQEAQAASQLLHPNAVTLFDFGVEDKLPYLVMEFIEGRTLKALIAEEKVLSLARVRSILEQISSALSAAHRLGIVHRDLKPENIMLRIGEGGREEVKVLDFGVAKFIGQSNSDLEQNLTVSGMIVGTPQYMSPEQCKGEALDVRADVYSLGVVTYEMLSGDIPFRAPSVLELLIKVVNERAQPLREFHPELLIPETVDKTVTKALEKKREDRYASVSDFFADFDQAVRDVLTPQELAPPKPPIWRSPTVWAGSTVILLALFAVGLASRSGDSSDANNPAFEKRAKEMVESAKRLEREHSAALAEAERLRKEAEERAAELARQEAARDQELRARMEEAMKAEQEKDEALRQAELAKAEAARLTEAAKKAEDERAVMVRQIEDAKDEKQTQDNRIKKLEEAPANNRPVTQVDNAANQEAVRRKVEQARLEAAARRAREEKEIAERRAETLRLEAARQASVAKRAQEEAARARESRRQVEEERTKALQQAEPPPAVPAEEPAAPKRRRCGPTWCM